MSEGQSSFLVQLWDNAPAGGSASGRYTLLAAGFADARWSLHKAPLLDWKNEHAIYRTRSEATMQRMNWAHGILEPAPEIRETVKTLGQLEGIFQNASAWSAMDPGIVVYRVQAWYPVVEGTEGGLFWGTTLVEPGQIDCEYFMTHGHFHAKRDRTEYYATIEGEGALILMDESRKTWTEPMTPGSVHFIPPRIAHRVANCGSIPLRFVACWPSDAGHDYEAIRKSGFDARLLNVNGEPKLVRSRT